MVDCWEIKPSVRGLVGVSSQKFRANICSCSGKCAFSTTMWERASATVEISGRRQPTLWKERRAIHLSIPPFRMPLPELSRSCLFHVDPNRCQQCTVTGIVPTARVLSVAFFPTGFYWAQSRKFRDFRHCGKAPSPGSFRVAATFERNRRSAQK